MRSDYNAEEHTNEPFGYWETMEKHKRLNKPNICIHMRVIWFNTTDAIKIHHE